MRVPKYWQAGTVKNWGNMSCELRERRRDKSKTERKIRKGPGLKSQVQHSDPLEVMEENEWAAEGETSGWGCVAQGGHPR